MPVTRTSTHLIPEASLPSPVMERLTWVRAALLAQRHDGDEPEGSGLNIAMALLQRSCPWPHDHVLDRAGTFGFRYKRDLFKPGTEAKSLPEAQARYYRAALMTLQIMFDLETNAAAS